MKTCGPGCPAVCDFCRWQDPTGQFTGEGWCWKHLKFVELYEGCDDFFCMRVKPRPKWRKRLLWFIKPFARNHF